MITNSEKLMNIMMNSYSNSYFLWDLKCSNWCILSSNIPSTIINETMYSDPITAIIESKTVHEEDVDILIKIREKILLATTEIIPERILTYRFRIKSPNNYKPVVTDNNSDFSVIVDDSNVVNDTVTYEWNKFIVYLSKDALGQVTETACLLRTMTDLEVMNKEILEHFTNDTLPDIFFKRVRSAIEEKPYANYAFIQFDIKSFKLVNSTKGEAFGNEVLTNIRNILHLFCNNQKLYTRLNSDIYAIVTEYNVQQEVLDFIEVLNSSINHYKDIEFEIYYGINFVTNATTLPARLLCDYAGVAKNSIKDNALTHIAIYNEDLLSTIKNDNKIESIMHKALNDKEFVMYLQPKYDMTNNQVVGAEALVRWIKEDGTMLQPSSFIPLFEKNRFIIQVDKFIWKIACETIRRWYDTYNFALPISINVSRVHLDNTDFIDYLNFLINKYNIPKNMLEVEITETVNNNNTEEAIKALKDNGYILLMDDFGSGYSSLKLIHSTQFDVLKIDRSFLSEFLNSDRGKKIISHTIEMSKDIGLKLVAEGVETVEQENFLLESGCSHAQGFLFSKPLPLNEFEKKFL